MKADESYYRWLILIKDFPFLSKEKETELIKKAQSGDIKARNELIKSYFKFVVYIAKKIKSYKVSMMDKVSEGNLGLMKAVEKFDIKKGVRFMTYAGYWIKQFIVRSVERDDRTIRMPYTMQFLVVRYCREYGDKKISPKELAIKYKIPLCRAKRIMKAAEMHIYSLDAVYKNHASTNLQGIIPGSLSINTDAIEAKIDSEIILNNLNSREKDIVKRRYGIGGDQATLQEIGDVYHLSRERIRQIGKKAFEKIGQAIK